MKHILAVLLIIITFSSCEQFINYKLQTYEDAPDGYDVRAPQMKFDSIHDLRFYIANNLRYMSDNAQFGRSDYWQAPQQTIDNGAGDCEDYAILCSWFLRDMGYDVSIIGILPTKSTAHAIIRVNGVYMEPQGLYLLDASTLDIAYEMTLDRALSICYNEFHSRAVLQ